MAAKKMAAARTKAPTADATTAAEPASETVPTGTTPAETPAPTTDERPVTVALTDKMVALIGGGNELAFFGLTAAGANSAGNKYRGARNAMRLVAERYTGLIPTLSFPDQQAAKGAAKRALRATGARPAARTAQRTAATAPAKAGGYLALAKEVDAAQARLDAAKRRLQQALAAS